MEEVDGWELERIRTLPFNIMGLWEKHRMTKHTRVRENNGKESFGAMRVASWPFVACEDLRTRRVRLSLQFSRRDKEQG